MSQSDVAGHIHIRSVYLAAIESEDWSAIGAPVYVRGFLRTYARFLGLDPEAAVQAFNESAGAQAAAAAEPPPLPAGGMRGTDPRRAPVWGLVATVVALLLVAFVGYEYWQYQTGQTGSVVSAFPGGATAAASPSAPAAPAGGTAESSAASPSPARAATPAPKDQLVVRVSESSWLRVVVDGAVATEGTLPAGTTRTFHGHAATLRIGNAGGVHVAVNGRDVGALGATGDVVEKSFRLGE